MGDFKKIFAILPPDNQPMALRDRKTFLRSGRSCGSSPQMAENAEARKMESPPGSNWSTPPDGLSQAKLATPEFDRRGAGGDRQFYEPTRTLQGIRSRPSTCLRPKREIDHRG